jgi:hypothetical protein
VTGNPTGSDTPEDARLEQLEREEAELAARHAAVLEELAQRRATASSTGMFGLGRTPPVPDGRLSVTGIGVALAAAAGVAAAITLLYSAMAYIMIASGGMVASGGPYAIEHPAPSWIAAFPLSIFAMLGFAGLGIYGSNRGWGINPVAPTWAALFLSLGWNFLRVGMLAVRAGATAGWTWVVCGVFFWVMGVAPIVGAVRAVASRRTPGTVGDLPESPSGPAGAYVAAQAAGVALGIVGGITIFVGLAV